MSSEVIGKLCVFCGIWYESTDVVVCIKCKEYKGITEVTEDQWFSDEFTV